MGQSQTQWAPKAVLDELKALEEQNPATGESPETPPEAPDKADDAAKPAAPPQLTVPGPSPGAADGATPPDGSYAKRVAALEERAEAADQRWRTLQGMRKKELEELQHLKAENERLKTEPRGVPPSASEPWTETDYRNAGLDDDQLDYPEDEREMARRIALAVVRGELAAALPEMVRNAVDEAIAPARERMSQDAQVVFEDSVTKLEPQWPQAYEDPQFNPWLDGIEEYSGFPYRELLRDACDQKDAGRAARIFQRFFAEHPRPGGASAHTMPAQRGTGPGGAGPASHGKMRNGKPVYSLKEAEQLLDSITSGTFTPERAAQKSKEFDDAVAEGRVEGYPQFRGW